jgi:ParB-like chromosome segregation protein Spo0J
MMYANQPISSVVWVERDKLRANDYNPNHVAPPELKLLEQSILEDGWTQPLVIRPTDEADVFEIVDGFHRWTVSDRPSIRILTDGHVPTVLITPDPSHQRLSTIRHNRARGKHHVVKMADIVDDLLADGYTSDDLVKLVGMDHEEVSRLSARGKMTDAGGKGSFGESWRPA